MPRGRWAVPVIAAAAALAVLPQCFLGSASGHDFIFHLETWLDGAKYSGLSGWSALSNFGYGEPRFIFYPPLTALLGSAMARFLPVNLVAGSYAFVVLAAAGLAMFALAQRCLPAAHALVAAAFYAVNPYLLLCLYQRGAFAEMLACALGPLLILFALETGESSRGIVPLGVVLAGFWTADLPAAVLATYAVAFLALLLAWQRRSWAALPRAAAALALGLALAAFYVYPAAYERPWVQIGVLFEGGPWDWKYIFHYDSIPGPVHRWFPAMINSMAAGEAALTIAGAVFSWRWRQEHRTAWLALAGLGGMAGFLLLPASRPLWQYLPELAYVQFPWRCLLLLTPCLTLLVTASLSRFSARWAAGFLLAVALAGGIAATATAWWYPQVGNRFEAYLRTFHGYMGHEGFIPQGGDPDTFMRFHDAPEAVATGPRASVRVVEWAPRAKTVVVSSPVFTRLVLHLVSYPAWQLRVNGVPAPAERNRIGCVVVPLSPGESRVELTFRRTADRNLGLAISLFAGLVLAAALLLPLLRLRK
jgi:hypothetical protein